MASLSLRQKRLWSRIKRAKATPDRRHLLLCSLPSALCQDSNLIFAFKNLTRSFVQISWRKPQRANTEQSLRPVLRALPSSGRCLQCFPASVSTWLPFAVSSAVPWLRGWLPLFCFLGWQTFPHHYFLFIIRCNLDLLCYKIFPWCFANMTHPL